MITLSQLLHFRLVDHADHTARLDDFLIDVSAGIYPPLTQLVYRGTREDLRLLDWDQVLAIDLHSREIVVQDLDRGLTIDMDQLDRTVLVKRDLLDGLMLDLQARATVVANDVILKMDGNKIQLQAIDVSFLAVLRRLTRNLVPESVGHTLRDWKYMEFFRGDPSAARAAFDSHGVITHLPPGEIAYLAGFLPYLHAAELVTLLPDPMAADTMEILIPELQMQVFEELAPDKAERLLSLMRPDIAADLLGRLDPSQASSWIEKLPPSQAERVLRLLAYPVDTAGGIMTNDIVTLPAATLVADAITILRQTLKSSEYINFIQLVYVVDDEDQQLLQGMLSLRDLLIAEEGCRLEEIMNPYLLTLNTHEKAQTTARRVIESALAALPVIEEGGQIVGVVTIDTALNLISPKPNRREILLLNS